jgi:aminoglycoside phosphotransferase family enzyme/predicted kinase
MGNLKDDLRRASAYAATGVERIDFAETHISLVFLVGDDVYKVKKPVCLGFLDFRTLEQRRRACEAEVSLNRRLAPGIYRGVVPVRRRADGTHHLLSDGEVVDWAVHMVRLPDERRADRLVARGSLDGPTVERVAAHLARFHASARSDAETASFGLPEAIAVSVRENFAQTRDVVGRHLDPAQADEIERWQLAFLRDRDALFRARVRAGRVRDGHGDLRLEHLYVGDDGSLTIIDCIEFNDRFRYADVCADLAFLSMDLAWHGRVDLAERLLAAYARETGDYDLYALVDFYESYRAYVRAKVATMLAADASADLETRARAGAEARRYFLLALSAERRSLVGPAVVAVGGVIASGKSTIATRLGESLGAPVIEADRTRKQMLGIPPTQAIDEASFRGAYDPAFTDRVYDEVLRRADVVVSSGRPVVLDASFRSVDMRRRARSLATAHGVPFRFVECRATRDVCLARLSARERDRGISDGRGAIFDDFCARWEPVAELSADEHVVLDTSRPLAESLAAVEAHVETWPRGLVS